MSKKLCKGEAMNNKKDMMQNIQVEPKIIKQTFQIL